MPLLQGIVLTQGSNPHLRGLCIAGGFFPTEPSVHATQVCSEGSLPQGEFALYTWDLEIRAIFSLENWDMARKKKPE